MKTTQLYTSEEIAAIFKVSVRTVWKKCRTGEWPHMALGRHYRFSADDIHQITEILRPKPVRPIREGKRMPI